MYGILLPWRGLPDRSRICPALAVRRYHPLAQGCPSPRDHVWLPCCCWTDSSPSTLLDAMSLLRVSSMRGTRRDGRQAYSPACQLPSPRMDSACTLVMRNKFSVSARLAESWASCDWSWAWKQG